jgi:hypothetical protein
VLVLHALRRSLPGRGGDRQHPVPPAMSTVPAPEPEIAP